MSASAPLPQPPHRGRWRWLAVAFLIVPLVEIAVIVRVGQVIGAWPTVLLLLAVSVLGAWIVKLEGTRAWRDLRRATRSGRMPSNELMNAALVLAGGVLLLTPGFVTDLVGLICVVPLTRPLARIVTRGLLGRRVHLAGAARAAGPSSGAVSGGRVVQGEVIDPGERPHH